MSARLLGKIGFQIMENNPAINDFDDEFCQFCGKTFEHAFSGINCYFLFHIVPSSDPEDLKKYIEKASCCDCYSYIMSRKNMHFVSQLPASYSLIYIKQDCFDMLRNHLTPPSDLKEPE